VYSNGVHVGFGKVTRDLTERKAAELQVIAAYEESDNLKSQFLANMSHEIRTPMHGMLSANLLLLGTQLTDDQLDLANIIEESGQVLLQVINDILDYSKLAAGGFSVISDIMNISQIIHSVARGYQMTLKHGVTFDLRLSPDLPKIVKGDSLRYRQVVQNLLSNGSKFTEHGSVSLQVSVSEESDDEYTILTEIIDTGIGIEGSAGRLLFTPFTQFDTSRTKRFQGTGLGLSISKSLTELMGGHIKFRPNPSGRGSIFSFTVKVQKVPIESPTPAQLQLATENLSLTPSVDPADLIKTIAASKRLLLAEDNPINQRIMLKVLKALGFTNIAAVSDGVEAVRLMTSSDTERPALSIKSVPASDPGLRDEPNVDFPPESSLLSRPAAQRFDLILMDINMPRMDGFGATTAIRNLGVWVPIVAMTANALRGDREQCIRNGMNDYISKPVKREQLVEVLKRWLIDGTPTWTGGAGTSRRASVLGLGLSDTTNGIES
jgi:osomolarity two-component system sensor histidine kinase TcsA